MNHRHPSKTTSQVLLTRYSLLPYDLKLKAARISQVHLRGHKISSSHARVGKGTSLALHSSLRLLRLLNTGCMHHRTPVVVFLSDGGDNVSDASIYDLCRSAVRQGFV